MSTEKFERLLNLIALLRQTRRPLSAAQIREKLHDYDGQTDDTFHRTFERDKKDIKGLGYDLIQEDTDAWGGETGYLIARETATLSDPGFTPDEIAALSLAAQMGRSDDGALGLLKLIGDGDPATGPAGWMLPRVALGGAIAALTDAIARRKVVRFSYRTRGGDETTEREVEPHGLYHRGTWYLQGFDRSRDGTRVFKLSRLASRITVEGGLEPDFDEPDAPSLEVLRGPWEGEQTTAARVAFAPEVAWWVERRTGAARASDRDDGWVELDLSMGDEDAFAGWVAGFGARAEALAPPELRAAVVDHLRAVAGGA
jgi:proteasome accessory factor B